jgi:hypothetical protein
LSAFIRKIFPAIAHDGQRFPLPERERVSNLYKIPVKIIRWLPGAFSSGGHGKKRCPGTGRTFRRDPSGSFLFCDPGCGFIIIQADKVVLCRLVIFIDKFVIPVDRIIIPVSTNAFFLKKHQDTTAMLNSLQFMTGQVNRQKAGNPHEVRIKNRTNRSTLCSML